MQGIQIKSNNKPILLCLLLYSLFFIGYISVLNTGGIISSDVLNIFSADGRGEHASMAGGTTAGYHDYLAATDTSTESSIFSMKQLRWPNTKDGSNMLTAIVAAQVACLSYYSRLSDQTYTQLNSSIITTFLHKKDGMK